MEYLFTPLSGRKDTAWLIHVAQSQTPCEKNKLSHLRVFSRLQLECSQMDQQKLVHRDLLRGGFGFWDWDALSQVSQTRNSLSQLSPAESPCEWSASVDV